VLTEDSREEDCRLELSAGAAEVAPVRGADVAGASAVAPTTPAVVPVAGRLERRDLAASRPTVFVASTAAAAAAAATAARRRLDSEMRQQCAQQHTPQMMFL